MNIENIREYCLSKRATTEGFPFNDSTLAFKVAGKIFALANLDTHPLKINLKCDPEKAIDLREHFKSVRPGYHMNKKHWNTLKINGEISREILINLIDHSYNLVIAKLSKKIREENLLQLNAHETANGKGRQ